MNSMSTAAHLSAQAGAWAGLAIELALRQLRASMDRFTRVLPGENTVGGKYRPLVAEGFPDGSNVGWTSGLWTGQLWLAYQLSGDDAFRRCAQAQLPGYARRLDLREDLATHDLGFLYTPSCVAAYRLTADAAAHDSALRAAAELITRYLPAAGVIQAWGDLNDPAQRGRMIIDCLMNLPLLYWAGEQTGDARYRAAAERHAAQALRYLIRPDASTFHTFHFDPASGAPLRGTTHQGHSDSSCWARGQAWGIYGFALNHRHAPELGLLDTACALADYFLAHLPPNGIVFWDLSFQQGSGEPWDSSASAIAAGGLLELAAQLGDGERATHYRRAALHILKACVDLCAGQAPDCEGLLKHGVYHRPHGRGVNEANLWGDYFYLEALARVARGLRPHW